MTRERILVVDDEQPALDACERALTRRDFHVRAVHSGTDALVALTQETFDLMMTDIKMPGIGGLELLRRAREMDPAMATVAVTGYGTLDTALASIKEGVTGFVVKPFTLQELGDAVESALEKRRLIHENVRLQLELDALRLAEEERMHAAREEAARREAEDTLRLHEGFVATVTHDLRGPLTTMFGNIHLLRRHLAAERPVPPSELSARLDLLERMAQKMRSLLEELIDIAHLRAGRMIVLSRRRTNLTELVQRVVAEYQQTVDRSIELHVEDAEVVGEWDAARLERVLDNLLSNAIKYSPAGQEITITVGRSADGWATLSVTDRGLGIPADELPQLFQHFFRARNAGPAFEGVGLGLAGAKQIVECHGGRIEAASHEGQGSTFTICLPLGEGEAPASIELGSRQLL